MDFQSELALLPASIVQAGRVTLLLNKCDLARLGAELLPDTQNGCDMLAISATSGNGIAALKQYLKTLMGYDDAATGGFSARRRHLDALGRATQHLADARHQLRASASGELVAEDLRLCQHVLAEITGKFTSDDLLGRIFSSFCIGK